MPTHINYHGLKSVVFRKRKKSFGMLRMVSNAEPFVSRFHPRDESRGIIARNKLIKKYRGLLALGSL